MYISTKVSSRCMPAWMPSILIIAITMLLPTAANALVCQQRSELPTSENTRAYASELPLRHQEGYRRGFMWHIHIDMPVECTWSGGQGAELAAEQQSAESLHIYLDPAWQDPQLSRMMWGISVDHGRSIYRAGQRMMMLQSNQHMPSFSIIRICDHHDEAGCRHWRNAPNQDYKTSVAFLLPIDLYFLPPLPQKSYLGYLLLQISDGQIRPDVRSRLNVPVYLPSLEENKAPFVTLEEPRTQLSRTSFRIGLRHGDFKAGMFPQHS